VKVYGEGIDLDPEPAIAELAARLA
jgi:hypothetical protein